MTADPATTAGRDADDGTAVAPDGSPVEIYRHLAPTGEADLIDAELSSPSDILELGAGTGRITAGLLARGHRVVAVDNSAEMLRWCPASRSVLADIVTLRLDERFDAVVLASHFVNDPPTGRAAFLATIGHHLRPDGLALIEAYPVAMDWRAAVGRVGRSGEVEIEVTSAHVEGRRVEAVVEYRLGDRSWQQPFVAVMLDESELRRSLEAADLAWAGWLDEARGWFSARPAARPS